MATRMIHPSGIVAHEPSSIEPTILFRDEHIVAVNKPSGLVVHRSGLITDRITCLSLVRDMVGRHVYPAHRLDRGTSGVLLFSLDPETARIIHATFVDHAMKKRYLAVVRGWLPEESEEIDYPLLDRNRTERQEAQTIYHRLAQTELPHAVGRYQTARYTLVGLDPLTGRTHQIRRHMAHLRHPVIGDTIHGDTKHNIFFRETLGVHRMLLHATTLSFPHPYSREILTLEAPLPKEFSEVIEQLGFSPRDGFDPAMKATEQQQK